MTGEGWVRFLTLEPITTGTAQLSAVYRRSWEDETENEQMFSMTFIVT
jgi:predicted secreted protein